MATGTIRLETNALNSSTQDMSRALLIIGGGILTYEVASTILNKVAGDTFKTLRAAWLFPIAGTTVFMLNATLLTTPELHVQFITLCIFYGAASIAARILKASKASSSSLPSYMVDMVQLARDGAYTSKVGYEPAIKKVAILMKTARKANAILLACPGIGKSTIPEMIAHNIASGLYKHHPVFAKAKIIQVGFTDLVAGTIWRGMLEDRVKEMIRLAKSDPTIIYFIDEIHVLTGGGEKEDLRADLSNMLLVPMARGHIRILGASTFKDYLRHIKPKIAFARRLPQVVIKEPTDVECFTMLKHSYAQPCEDELVKVSDQAIAAAIYFTKTNTQRFFPDKAIDVLEYAVSMAGMDDPNAEITLGVEQIAEAFVQATNSEQTEHVEELVPQFKRFINENSQYFPGLRNGEAL